MKKSDLNGPHLACQLYSRPMPVSSDIATSNLHNNKITESFFVDVVPVISYVK